ncbi:MAG: hypothetical protein QF662_08205, partial [Phycisphaerae bacterium]|nr:hypothetical protein [Phycisphaerae bacterium]
EGIALTYTAAVVIAVVVVCMVAAAFFVGKEYGTIRLPATKDQRTLGEIRGQPTAAGVLPNARQVRPSSGQPASTPAEAGAAAARPPAAGTRPAGAAAQPRGATTTGRYRLRIITLPVGAQTDKFTRFLAARGVETVTERAGSLVIISSKARFPSDTSPEAQGFRNKVVELGPEYTRVGGPTNLESCYFVKFRQR